MGMTITEKILARAGGSPKVVARRRRRGRCRDRLPDRPVVPAGRLAPGAEGRRSVEGGDRVRPPGARADRAGRGMHADRPRVRPRVRHRAAARCRPRPGHQPCGGRRQGLRAARHRAGERRLRTPAAPARSTAPRAASAGPTCCMPSPRARPGSASARRSATTSPASCGRACRPRTSSSPSPASGARTSIRTSSMAAPAWPAMSLNARRTLTTMGAELSAEFVIFEPDDTLIDYVRARNPTAVHADNAGCRRGVQGAAHDRPRHDRAAGGVARRGGEQLGRHQRGRRPSRSIRRSSAPAATARWTISRWRRAWCKGRRVAPGTRFIVTPSTEAIHRAALRGRLRRRR